MDRDLFFNEVSAYISANYPEIFLESVNHIFFNAEHFERQRERKISEVLSRYGISSEFLPQDN